MAARIHKAIAVIQFKLEGQVILRHPEYKMDDRLLLRKEEFLKVMREIRKKKRFDTVVLMITDVLLDGTQLLFVGDEETIRQAFNLKNEIEDCVFLPKIMSRKKQVIPMLSAVWG